MSLLSSDTLTLDLQSALRGRVVFPGDSHYDQYRAVFSGSIDRRPAVIARPVDASDVVRVIAAARATGLPLAIRSGGHSGAGHSTTDGGIVLDLRELTTLDVDTARRTAWAGSGLTAAAYSNGVGAHGLATGFGDTGSVGIGGITLGGGVGYLARKHGLTIDNLLAAEVVTASGEVLHVDESTYPDLFWAIRGGGGNFGVVTRFQFALHPVESVVGGVLILPATADLIAKTIEIAEAAPEELSLIANIMPAPLMPFVPQAHHGQLVVLILLCYAGAERAGVEAIAPLRALAPPITDLVRPMAYPELFPPDDPSYRPKAVGRTLFLRSVDRGSAETMIEHLQQSRASMRVVQLRVLGGAISRVDPDATAYAHRDAHIMANVASFYDGAAEKSVREQWVAALVAALDQGEPGAYVNFLGDEGEARIRAAYPGATWERLRAIKARYDPANLFRLNQNVPAAVARPARS